MNKLLRPIIENPKTSIPGLGAIISALLIAFKVVTLEQGAAIGTAATGLGLLFAPDATPKP